MSFLVLLENRSIVKPDHNGSFKRVPLVSNCTHHSSSQSSLSYQLYIYCFFKKQSFNRIMLTCSLSRSMFCRLSKTTLKASRIHRHELMPKNRRHPLSPSLVNSLFGTADQFFDFIGPNSFNRSFSSQLQVEWLFRW